VAIDPLRFSRRRRAYYENRNAIRKAGSLDVPIFAVVVERFLNRDRVIAAIPRAAGPLDLEVADVWRAKTNNRRAITRLRAGVPVTHQHRRVPHSRLNPRHLAEPRDDVLVWLSLAGLFAAYCATIWVFFPLL